MNAITIDATEFQRRLEALALSGIGPGLPRKRADAEILLRSLALTLGEGAEFTEKQLRLEIQRWLEAAGPRVDIDPVSLRRALVDAGYLLRDPAGRVYQVSLPEAPGIAFGPEVPALEPLKILRECRERAARRAEERRS